MRSGLNCMSNQKDFLLVNTSSLKSSKFLKPEYFLKLIHLSWWGFSSLEKGSLSGNLISLLNFLRRRSRQGGSELFSLVSRGRVCGNGSALQQERFRQDIKKYFFTWMEFLYQWSNTEAGFLERWSVSQTCQCLMQLNWNSSGNGNFILGAIR